MKVLAALLSALMLVATPAVLAQDSARPASRGQAVPAQRQPAAQPLTSIPQLCRLREQQILELVRTIAERSQHATTAAAAERQLANRRVQDLLRTERDLEQSWYHLECAKLLYGAR